MKIVIADPLELDSYIIDEIKKLGEVSIYDDTTTTPDETLTRIQDAEIMTAKWTSINNNIIDHAPSLLKYIIIPAAGFDRIDVKKAREKGITVINCPTYNSNAVANFTIALIFNLLNQVERGNADLKKGLWNPFAYIGTEVEGKKLGLIGHGNIGKKVEALAQKLGIEVSFTDSKSTDEEIDNLLRESDIVSLHLPLTEKSRHLLDERRLRLMKKDGYLINTARGAIIDQKALIQLLREGHFAGVALDVFENEPLTGQPNEEIMELVHMEKVLATPHIAFNSKETWERLGHELLANIKSCVEGKPINVVN